MRLNIGAEMGPEESKACGAPYSLFATMAKSFVSYSENLKALFWSKNNLKERVRTVLPIKDILMN